jgi:hypothetical protein
MAGTPFTLDLLVAVTCQETGHTWSVLRCIYEQLERAGRATIVKPDHRYRRVLRASAD